MGVLNVTPDSFSDGGEHATFEAAVEAAAAMVAAGADIIDVGGESTRPGAEQVSIKEELSRVLPVVERLVQLGLCVSVDTRHAQVAKACLDAGAHIINDVSGFRGTAMREVAVASECGLVAMHMKGESPATMQDDTRYEDVVTEVESYLLQQARMLEQAGIAPERICVDPGPGFGKTPEQSLALIEASPRLSSHGYALMAAVSRKSFIGAFTGIEDAKSRDGASALCAAAALNEGALVARVHNVGATTDAIAHSRRAIVALGSNMQDPVGQLDRAVCALRTSVPDTWVTRVSSYVESEPAYKNDQATFINAVAQVQTLLSPNDLLAQLNRIEDEQGRVRKEANGPRTLDLDVVDYEGYTSDDPHLILPHPRVLERDFVVTPLLEIAPGFVLADGKTVDRESIAYGRVLRIV